MCLHAHTKQHDVNIMHAYHFAPIMTMDCSHCRVQDELSMLPGFEPNNLTPTSSLAQPRHHSSSSRQPDPSSFPPSNRADPEQDPASAISGSEEEDSCIDQDQDSDEEAGPAADGDMHESHDESPQPAEEVAGEAGNLADVLATDHGDLTQAGAAPADESMSDDMKAQTAFQRHARPQTATSESPSVSAPFPEGRPAAATAMTKDLDTSALKGSGIADEYRRRMHFSKEHPPSAPLPAPPQDPLARVSMPRSWTKTNSYPEGQPSFSYALCVNCVLVSVSLLC